MDASYFMHEPEVKVPKVGNQTQKYSRQRENVIERDETKDDSSKVNEEEV